ncbi:hypothetical protein [Nitrospira sp. Nam74]
MKLTAATTDTIVRIHSLVEYLVVRSVPITDSLRSGLKGIGTTRVFYRELQALEFAGTDQQVQGPIRPSAPIRAWPTVATVRFETPPGQQAAVDFDEPRLWIGERLEVSHIFVWTLGHCRRARGRRPIRMNRLVCCPMVMSRPFQPFCGVP